MDYVMYGIFTLMFGGLAIMLFVVGTREYFMQKRLMATAITVPAEIVSKRIVSSTSSDTDRRTLRDNSTTSHLPEVRFAYTVAGVRYESETIYPTVIHHSFASKQAAEEDVAEYSVGAKVQAFVDTAHPERGFLRKSSSIGPVAFLIGGVLSLALLGVVYRFG